MQGNSRWLFCAWVMFGAVVMPGVASAQIYRWTDAQGTAHFSEQPPPGGVAQAIEVKPQVMERDQATKDSEQRTERIFAARRQEQEQALNKAGNVSENNDKECAAMRHEQGLFIHGGRFFKTDDNGERSYYSDDQIAAAKQALQTRIDQRCN